MSHLDPVSAQSMSFVFSVCQAHLEGEDLVVAVPAPASCRPSTDAGFGAPVAVMHLVHVECEPGPRRRADRREYPSSPRYAQHALFRFRGGVHYGRAPGPAGWALLVQGAVRSIAGLPAEFSQCEAVLVEPHQLSTAARSEGPLNGPHLPYP